MTNNELLNERVREIIEWHFNENTGSEYWLEIQRNMRVDVRKEIKSFEDLCLFGFFEEDVLSKINTRKLIPRGYLKNGRPNKPIRIFESGGSKGKPKRIIDCEYREEVSDWLSECLDMHGFKENCDWLHIGPSGPHIIGFTSGNMAFKRNGICYFIDFDPRWVKYCMARGDQETADSYINHILAQSEDILKTQNVKYIFSTPKMMEYIVNKLSLKDYGIEGVICGGTHITTDTYLFLKREYLNAMKFALVYGNTLAGIAILHPDGVNDAIRYYPQFPNFVLDVVDSNDVTRSVENYERGRVKVTTLTKDLFIPNLLERDSAIKIPPEEIFKCYGVADVEPFTREIKAIEGVY
jgi:hypothetical protein